MSHGGFKRGSACFTPVWHFSGCCGARTPVPRHTLFGGGKVTVMSLWIFSQTFIPTLSIATSPKMPFSNFLSSFSEHHHSPLSCTQRPRKSPFSVTVNDIRNLLICQSWCAYTALPRRVRFNAFREPICSSKRVARVGLTATCGNKSSFSTEDKESMPCCMLHVSLFLAWQCVLINRFSFFWRAYAKNFSKCV